MLPISLKEQMTAKTQREVKQIQYERGDKERSTVDGSCLMEGKKRLKWIYKSNRIKTTMQENSN